MWNSAAGWDRVDSVMRDLGYDPATGEQTLPSYAEQLAEHEKAGKLATERKAKADVAVKQAIAKSTGTTGETTEPLGPPPPSLVEKIGNFLKTTPKAPEEIAGLPESSITAPEKGTKFLNFALNVAKGALVNGVSSLEDMYDSVIKYISKPPAEDLYGRQANILTPLLGGIGKPYIQRGVSTALSEVLDPLTTAPTTATGRFVTDAASLLLPALVIGKALPEKIGLAKTLASPFVDAQFVNPDHPYFLDMIHALPPVMQDDVARFKAGKLSEAEYEKLLTDRMTRRFGGGVEFAALTGITDIVFHTVKAWVWGSRAKTVAENLDHLTAAYNPRASDVGLLDQYMGKLKPEELQSVATEITHANEAALRPIPFQSQAEAAATLLPKGGGAEKAFEPAPATTLRETTKRVGELTAGPLTPLGKTGANISSILKNYGVENAPTAYEALDIPTKAVVDQLTTELVPMFGDGAKSVALAAVLGTGIFAKGNK